MKTCFGTKAATSFALTVAILSQNLPLLFGLSDAEGEGHQVADANMNTIHRSPGAKVVCACKCAPL